MPQTKLQAPSNSSKCKVPKVKARYERGVGMKQKDKNWQAKECLMVVDMDTQQELELLKFLSNLCILTWDCGQELAHNHSGMESILVPFKML